MNFIFYVFSLVFSLVDTQIDDLPSVGYRHGVLDRFRGVLKARIASGLSCSSGLTYTLSLIIISIWNQTKTRSGKGVSLPATFVFQANP